MKSDMGSSLGSRTWAAIEMEKDRHPIRGPSERPLDFLDAVPIVLHPG